MPAASQLSPSQREAFDEWGYLIVRGAFTARRVRSLVEAIERLIDRAHRGEIQIRWIDKDKRLPARTEGLLHPSYFDEALLQWQEHDLLDWLEAILAAPVRHSLFGMLAGGGGQSYQQGWHRDLADPGALTEQQLLDWLAGRCVQFNAPLQPRDRFLQIVPGSHLRTSTPLELQAAGANPQGDMPGMTTVHLEPGDIAFYNPNLWHRGWNPEGHLRWTIHAAYWNAAIPVMAHDFGQRAGFVTPGFLDKFPPRSRALVQRYLAALPEGQPLKAAELALPAAAG